MAKVKYLDDLIDKRLEERDDIIQGIRKRLQDNWRNDPIILNQYFELCVSNWKLYSGNKKPEHVLKLRALYKQALHGDIPEDDSFSTPLAENDFGLSRDNERTQAWLRIRGMPKDMAKRRFITFLAEIDPKLIDVIPDERPPDGFPVDSNGRVICAKCNCKAGCIQPLLDHSGMDLREQLFSRPELHEPENLPKWIQTALSEQRCIWGSHKAITTSQAKPFMAWFNRIENKGFFAYDSTAVTLIIRELVAYHFEVTYDMQRHIKEYTHDEYNAQASRALKLKEIYDDLSGESFVFEMPCSTNSSQCNERRRIDGGKNHFHPVEIEPPSKTDNAAYSRAIELRKECQRLGLSPSTGVVTDVEKRCELYKKRIDEFHATNLRAIDAKKRNITRAEDHAAEKSKISKLSGEILTRQMLDFLHTNEPEKVLGLVKRGCDPNYNTIRGVTPLICMVINKSSPAMIEQLVTLKADLNYVNKHGFTALMLACRLQDTVTADFLLKQGAYCLQKSSRIFGSLTALHWSVIHGAEEIVRLLMHHIDDEGGDSARVQSALNTQGAGGMSSLMLAAKRRNGLMCRLLLELGAHATLRNDEGKTAAMIARDCGWKEISDWLDKKIGAGGSKIQTFSDMQYNNKVKFESIRMREALTHFGKDYLMLIQERITTHPFGTPSMVSHLLFNQGDRAVRELQRISDFHQLFINERDHENCKVLLANDTDEYGRIANMRKNLAAMIDGISQGAVCPNFESKAPLFVTPLMCAAILNDVTSIRLLVQEGADVDQPNCLGTTALMQGSQLNNIEAVTELLLLRASITLVDNEGFNAIGYATSFPPPKCMYNNAVDTILDNDVGGAKLLTAAAILKAVMVAGGSVGNVKDLLRKNAREADQISIDNHFRTIKLLEIYGLSQLLTDRHMNDQMDSASRRLGVEISGKKKRSKSRRRRRRSSDSSGDDDSWGSYSDSDSSSDDEDGEKEDATQAAEEETKKKSAVSVYRILSTQWQDPDALEEAEPGDLRCPLCTLSLPCSHFPSVTSLVRHYRKNQLLYAAEDKSLKLSTHLSKVKLNKTTAAPVSAPLGPHNDSMMIVIASDHNGEEEASVSSSSKRASAVMRRQVMTEVDIEAEILEEMQLNNRKTDRSEYLMENYGYARKQRTSKERKYIQSESSVEKSSVQKKKTAERVEDDEPKPHSAPSFSLASLATLFGSESGESVDAETANSMTNSSIIVSAPKEELAIVPVEDQAVVAAEVVPAREEDRSQKVGSVALVVFASVDDEIEGGPEAQSSSLVVSSNALVTTASASDRISATSSIMKETAPGAPLVLKSILKKASAYSHNDFEDGVEGKGGTRLRFRDHNETLVFDENEDWNYRDDGSVGKKAISQNEDDDVDDDYDDDDEEMDRTVHSVKKHSLYSRRKNPYPVSQRWLFMLKGDRKHRSNASPDTKQSSSSLLLTNKEFISSKDGNNGGLVNLSPGTVNSDSDCEPMIVLSGWLFVGLSMPDENVSPPVRKVTLSRSAWYDILEGIYLKFREDWLPELRLEPAFDAHSKAILTPLCAACDVGIVRSRRAFSDKHIQSATASPASDRSEVLRREISDSPDPTTARFLGVSVGDDSKYPGRTSSASQSSLISSDRRIDRFCLACLVRYELYEGVKKVGGQGIFRPKTSLQGFATEWPFLIRDKTDRTENAPLNTALDRGIGIDSFAATGVSYSDTGSDNGESSEASDTASHDSAEDSDSKSNKRHLTAARPSSKTDLSTTARKRNDSSVHSNITFGRSAAPKQIKKIGSKKDERAAVLARTHAELILLPLLVAKTHFHDAERTLRMRYMLSQKKHEIDAGDRNSAKSDPTSGVHLRTPDTAETMSEDLLLELPTMLEMQAEMQKSMGSWVVSLGLLLDRADILFSILGIRDNATIEAAVKVSDCLRTLHCRAAGRRYARAYAKKIEALRNGTVISRKLLDDDSIAMEKRRFKQNADFWIAFNRTPLISQVMQNPAAPLAKSRIELFALRSLTRTLLSPRPSSAALVASFTTFCSKQHTTAQLLSNDNNNGGDQVGKLLGFAQLCVRLRTCENKDIAAYIIQLLLKRYLGKHARKSSELACVYDDVMPMENIGSVQSFVLYSMQPDCTVFDPVLTYAVKRLAVYYTRYLMVPAGFETLQRYVSEDAISFRFLTVSSIQAVIRGKLARVMVRGLRAMRAEGLRRIGAMRKFGNLSISSGITSSACEEDNKMIQSIDR